MTLMIPDVNEQLQKVKQQQQTIKSLIESGVLQLGKPFPGATKPTLLKEDAEVLCSIFGMYPLFSILSQIEDFEGGIFHYNVECRLCIVGANMVVGSGLGSCNSMEERYRYRTAQLICPDCGNESIYKSKYPDRETGDIGWYCNRKVGGCGSNFVSDDSRITSQKLGKVENVEPYTLVNTILKMAQKRALVAAVLVTLGASRFFTQDAEDISVDFGGNETPTEPETAKPKAQPAKPDAKPKAPPKTQPKAKEKSSVKQSNETEIREKLLAEVNAALLTRGWRLYDNLYHMTKALEKHPSGWKMQPIASFEGGYEGAFEYLLLHHDPSAVEIPDSVELAEHSADDIPF